MKTDWIKTRQTRYTAYATLYIVIIIGVLTLVNFLANRHNKSYDSTANKRFSLSDQTEKVVKNLKQDVTISYYDVSSRFASAQDLLGRYDNLSPKLSVEYVDVLKNPQRARAEGVRTEGTVFVKAGDKKEEARGLTEEEITGALIRALKTGTRSVCFVQGSGEHSISETNRDGYSQFKDALEKNNYQTRTISLLEKPEVPSDCTIVVVGGPRFDYVEPAVNALRAYVEGGGSALFMIDPPLRMGRENIADNPGLVKLLESWGVKAEKDLVLDTSGFGQIFGLSAAVPLVVNYESHAIVREMKEVATAFPLSRSLDTTTAEKTSVDKLFSTSNNSFATTNLSSAEIRPNESKDKKGPLTLGVAGTYDTGKENQKGRFVVTGSSGWVTNGFLRFNGNRDLVLNMINWLSADEDLISIRPKEPEDRRLTLTGSQMRVVFYSSVVFLPLLIIAAGLGVWWRRR
ncbi:MAG: GldG family protein [Bryobacteraceae bacterium]|nr:GldG family protein [Bryobacterales bacterium]MEB2363268.1 GldG family protein [Bryobacterales bacterium]NUN03504.1 GldG family protein [Bryobacteraceae bacterium]